MASFPLARFWAQMQRPEQTKTTRSIHGFVRHPGAGGIGFTTAKLVAQ
jgi:hypothetical protein